jgi:hypothetical protein
MIGSPAIARQLSARWVRGQLYNLNDLVGLLEAVVENFR